MVSTGNTCAGLYFNIGLAESALNHTGKAMLAFEQARRIKPGNSVILKAIVDEGEKITDATIPVDPFFLKEMVQTNSDVVPTRRVGNAGTVHFTFAGDSVRFISAEERRKLEDFFEKKSGFANRRLPSAYSRFPFAC